MKVLNWFSSSSRSARKDRKLKMRVARGQASSGDLTQGARDRMFRQAKDRQKRSGS